jgi:hypothetical protein
VESTPGVFYGRIICASFADIGSMSASTVSNAAREAGARSCCVFPSPDRLPACRRLRRQEQRAIRRDPGFERRFRRGFRARRNEHPTRARAAAAVRPKGRRRGV